ncbi:MAG: hypothetical protein H0V48_07925 [Nocardioidaceae bacterium]|nr:hypothetical protein [Nocardioidaceae bacterium]
MDAFRYRRPALPGGALFDALPGDADPAQRAETGARIAGLLVRGARTTADEAVIGRLVRLADDHGLDLLADLWQQAPPESLAGALWRLYLLRTWVHREPGRAAREYDTGRRYAPVHEVVAGVVEPPGPDEVCQLVDTVLRGVAVSDLAVTLERAAAFARVVATGRAHLPEERPGSTRSAARLITTAEQLEFAGRLERAGELT